MAFFDPHFLDEIRDKLVLSNVIGRFISVQKKGREFQALCPFHKEKTPSFTINDEKGFYHCFGCGAHGDALKFVQEHKGLPFPETVEFLANMAGLPIPQNSPQQQKAYEKKKSLYDVNDLASKWFEHNLQTPAGSAAKAYLLNRGFTEDIIKQYRIGFAADSFDSLREHLLQQKVEIGDMAKLGLVITPENIDKKPYDRFRGRVMFPIIDLKGRIIAFGGRILGEGQPKYMNSPETPLFNKSESLFNINFARDAAYKEEQFLVVEGYTDAISLAQAGIGQAVAPLGTALTTEQITKMWRYVPTITMCFDGDNAGKRAALRAAERAIPLLNSQKHLKFLTLPGGSDPDEYVKTEGADGFRKQISDAKSLSGFLWSHFTEGHSFETPEKQAKLRADLEKAIQPLTDEGLKESYQAFFKKQIWESFRRAGGARGPKIQIKTTKLDQPEVLLLLCAINHPFILEEHEEQISTIDLQDENLRKVLKNTLEAAHFQTNIDRDKLILYLKEMNVFAYIEPFFDNVLYGKYKFMRPDADENTVRQRCQRLFNNLQINRLNKEIKQVEQELAKNMTAVNNERLTALRQEVHLLSRLDDDDI